MVKEVELRQRILEELLEELDDIEGLAVEVKGAPVKAELWLHTPRQIEEWLKEKLG